MPYAGGMFLGDVLAWVAGLIGLFLTTWATILACSLLFDRRTGAARDDIEAKPAQAFLRGLLIQATIGALAIAMISNPLPLLKVVGFAVVAWLLAIAAVGTGGIALLISDRIRARQELPEFTAMSRAAAITVGIGMVPIAGWLLFGPAVFTFGLGAGWKACVRSIKSIRNRSHATDAA